MPQTSTRSSSCRSSDSEHVPHRYINLKYCINVFHHREDIATAIRLTNNNRTAYTKILLLDHLFQTIQQTKQQLE
jgi:hypothetical protein